MGAPTVYYYDDPGAPVLTNIQDAFYQILMACLVNGYGSKPAAGWSVVHDQWAAHGHASFTNNTESGVLGLVRNTTSGFGPYLYIAEAMVDYQTAVTARSGMRSNINPATLATASLTGRQRAHGGSWQRWVCIADEQGAWVFFGDTDNRLFNPWALGDTYGYFTPIYVGAFNNYFGLGSRNNAELGNFVIVGGIGDGLLTLIRGNDSTLFYNKNGVLANDGAQVVISYFSINSNLESFMHGFSVADGFSRFPIAPVCVIDATSTSAGQRIALGDFGMLYGSYELSAAYSYSFAQVFSRRIFPVGSALRDVLTLDGRSFLIVKLAGRCFGLISLDADDWA